MIKSINSKNESYNKKQTAVYRDSAWSKYFILVDFAGVLAVRKYFTWNFCNIVISVDALAVATVGNAYKLDIS